MDEGRIIDQGKHSVLIDRNKQYSHLIKTFAQDDKKKNGNCIANKDKNQSSNIKSLNSTRFEILGKYRCFIKILNNLIACTFTFVVILMAMLD